MVWKPKKAETEKEEGEKSEGEPEKQPEKPAGTEGGEELVEEAHPDSTGLLKAAYSLDEQGMTAVARESKEHTSYLVRFDGIVYPDPAGFDARREQIRLQLLQKKQVEYFNAWSIRLRQEAYGGTAPVGEGEEIARAGGG
jgi:hypothetical protein